LQEDLHITLRRRISIIGSAEQSQKNTTKKISSSLKSFISNKEFKARQATTNALIDSNYTSEKKDKQKAFKDISNNITELSSNPDMLLEKITRKTIHLQDHIPNIANIATERAVSGLNFLNSKLPKPASNANGFSKFTKREFEPSELQLAKFERYLQAVENPMSVLDDLESGTLTREAAEAVQTVYPKLFSEIQNQTLEQLENNEEPISYAKRVQMSILLDINTDSSMLNQNIAKFQSSFIPEENQGPTPARADNVNFADREQTKQNQIAQK